MPSQALAITNPDDQATDYELMEGHQSCWITVNNISVYIRRTDEGVSVQLYPLNNEFEDSLGETWATFAEASEDK